MGLGLTSGVISHHENVCLSGVMQSTGHRELTHRRHQTGIKFRVGILSLFFLNCLMINHEQLPGLILMLDQGPVLPGPARPGGRILSLSTIRIKLINDDCPLVTATGHWAHIAPAEKWEMSSMGWGWGCGSHLASIADVLRCLWFCYLVNFPVVMNNNWVMQISENMPRHRHTTCGFWDMGDWRREAVK